MTLKCDSASQKLKRNFKSSGVANEDPAYRRRRSHSRSDSTLHRDILSWIANGFHRSGVRGHHSEVPVLIISARHNLEAMERAKDLRVNDYIAKPFDFHLLVKRLGEIAG